MSAVMLIVDADNESRDSLEQVLMESLPHYHYNSVSFHSLFDCPKPIKDLGITADVDKGFCLGKHQTHTHGLKISNQNSNTCAYLFSKYEKRYGGTLFRHQNGLPHPYPCGYGIPLARFRRRYVSPGGIP